MSEAQLTAELANIRAWHSALGVTGGEHGSYFSNVIYNDMIAYPVFRKHFRSMRTFANGASANPPMKYGESFPFGDPMNIRALNGATSGWGVNTGNYLINHVQQAITNKGVAYFAWHNEIGSATTDALTGFNALLTFLDANRDTVEVCTEEDLYNI